MANVTLVRKVMQQQQPPVFLFIYIQGSRLTRKPGFWRIKIMKYPVLTLKKKRSCVILTRQKFQVLRRNSTRLIKNR